MQNQLQLVRGDGEWEPHLLESGKQIPHELPNNDPERLGRKLRSPVPEQEMGGQKALSK
jgi:hypothetical protein